MLYLLVLVALLFTIQHDSIKNLVTKDRREEARAHLRLVYKNCNEQNADRYIERIRSTCGSDSSNLTLRDALANPQYRTTTWANLGYIVFHELTGINVILIYSN